MKDITVKHRLSAVQLAALLWDGMEEFDPPDILEQRRAEGFVYSGGNYTPRLVRKAVSEQLRIAGESSVDCGPQRKWKSDEQEAWYQALVKGVYEIS